MRQRGESGRSEVGVRLPRLPDKRAELSEWGRIKQARSLTDSLQLLNGSITLYHIIPPACSCSPARLDGAIDTDPLFLIARFKVRMPLFNVNALDSHPRIHLDSSASPQ